MFKKRIFNLKSLSIATLSILKAIPSSIAARRHKRISSVFAEKIRLAATSVNNCIYCSYGHTKIAMRVGVARDEIELLLKGEIGKHVSAYETPALLFAQHFAETQGRPESLMRSQLYNFYGNDHAADILVFLREIQFGNICGNTFEAFLSRLKGNAAPGSNVFFEVAFFLLTFPLLGILHVLQWRK